MTFEELNIKKTIKNNLADAGMNEMTRIQERAFPAIMSGRDVMGVAQTGTGKTIAYLLPSVNLWKFSPKHEVQVLILVPTRELVVQVLESLERLTANTGIMSAGVYGGYGIQPQAARIREGADFLVGTPGRVLDLALVGHLRLGNVRRLILDEVDEMLDQGFRTQIGRVLDLLPAKRQNLMFSATMTEDVERLADVYFNGPLKIEAAPAGTPVKNVEQKVIMVKNFNTKVNLLLHMLRSDDSLRRVMVFVSTIALADDLYARILELMPELDVEEGKPRIIDYLHSRRTQSQRFGALSNFRNGDTKILISTDIMARGIDVEDVSHVICFDLPTEPEQYIHRIGRTGRVSPQPDGSILVKDGVAISFCAPYELGALANIEGLMRQEIARQDLPDDVEVSDVMAEFEMPQVRMKNALDELDATPGNAFHERAEHNQKVNKRVSHKAVMRAKYGKPIRRSNNKKR